MNVPARASSRIELDGRGVAAIVAVASTGRYHVEVLQSEDWQ